MNNIKILRKENQLTQKQMAEIINVTERAYSNYETNRRKLTPEIAITYAKYFNCSTDVILDRTPIDFKNTPLNNEEMNLINDYNELSDTNKATIKTLIKSLKKK